MNDNLNANISIEKNAFVTTMQQYKEKERQQQFRLKQYKDVLETILNQDAEKNPHPYLNLMKLIGAEQSPLQRNIVFNIRRVASEELFSWIKKEPDRNPVTSPNNLNELQAEVAIDMLSNTYRFLGVASYKELHRAVDPDHPSGKRQFGHLAEEELAEFILTQAVAMTAIRIPDGQTFRNQDGLLANTINRLMGSTLPCIVPEAPEASASWDNDPWEDGRIEEDPLDTIIAREETWDD